MTFTFGNVIQIASTIVIVFAAYARLAERLTRVETKVDMITERRRIPRD